MEVQRDPLLMQALRGHVERCEDPDHGTDRLSLCRDLLSSLDHQTREDLRSAEFTVEPAMAGVRDRVPEEVWSTTALLGALREALSSPPWRQPLKRPLRCTG